MSYTTDPNDPRIGRGPGDESPGPQNDVYLILPGEERAKGFVRPVRQTYRHVGLPGVDLEAKGLVGGQGCGSVTTMALPLAETYARDPSFYGATYCCTCRMHRPVAEFVWDADGTRVGS